MHVLRTSKHPLAADSEKKEAGYEVSNAQSFWWNRIHQYR